MPVLPRLVSAVAVIAGTLLVALICFTLLHASQTQAALALMLFVLVVGAYGKRLEAILTSLAAALCLDYFFIPPIGRITIGDSQGWISFLAFLITSLIATNLSSALRRQRDELRARQTESERIHALSRAILLSSGGDDVRRILVNKCMEIFHFTEVALFEAGSGRFWRSSTSGAIPADELRRVAILGSVAQIDNVLTIIPITLGNKPFGSLGFRGNTIPASSLESLGNTMAVGLAQAQAQEASTRADAVRKSEELKSVMIDALAHDLKTPLTAIEAATEVLVQPNNITPDQRAELLQVVREEARGLGNLVAGAIHLARIDAKRLRLESAPLEVAELINEAVDSLGERVSAHTVRLELTNSLPLVFGDRELLLQALKQLLDNAVKYSPDRSQIIVAAHEANGLVSISVRDHGPGLTELEQSRVFDKFYRGRYDQSSIQGTGMGLPIAKEIAVAHGGSLGVESQVGSGSQFTLTLQAASMSQTSV